jgi:hypothetical protein
LLAALFTLAAIALMIIHLTFAWIRIDTITITLLIVAALPWLSTIFEAIKLPGGIEFRYLKLEAQVKANEYQIERLYALSMSDDTLNQLRKLSNESFGEYYLDPKLKAGLATELNYLKVLGYIRFNKIESVKGIEDLPTGLNPGPLHQWIEVTNAGREFLKLRDNLGKDAAAK